jgi:hypothetical protein
VLQFQVFGSFDAHVLAQLRIPVMPSTDSGHGVQESERSDAGVKTIPPSGRHGSMASAFCVGTRL